MFIVAVLVFPQSVVYPNIKSKKTDAIQNNNKRLIQLKKNSKASFWKTLIFISW